jgi:uncharacterized membrane protein (UPF0127 family)
MVLSLAGALAGCTPGNGNGNGNGDGNGDGSGNGDGARPGFALVVVSLDGAPPAGAAAVARVEIAATPTARERGLMGREFLPEDTGMLFVYPEDRTLGFWMKGCPAPLSAAFLDAEGRVLNIEEMLPGTGVPDADLPRYPSKGLARYALEMERGWFTRKGIKPGDRADLGAALRGVSPR